MEFETWREWDRYDWNLALSKHYFLSKSENPPSVSSLSVSAEDLKRVTGDLTADPEDVKHQFLSCIRGALGGDKNGSAFKQKMITSGSHQKIPLSFSFLYVSCLAANEILENDEDDGSSKKYKNEFRKVMEDLLEIKNVQIDESLAETWESFSKFLRENEIYEPDGQAVLYFRKLLLPDQGNETHIGYSKRLVFPSRRDQEQLAIVLRLAHLLEEHPPLDLVVKVIGNSKKNFSRTFLEAFEEFTEAVRIGTSNSVLLEHRFWTVVVSTCSNGLLALESGRANISILMNDSFYGDYFYQLVANDGEVPTGYVADVSDHFDGWPQTVSFSDQTVDSIRQVLENPVGMGWLGGLIRGGLVPFYRRDDQWLQVSTPSMLDNSNWALVRKDCFEDVNEKFNYRNSMQTLDSPHENWLFVSGIRLHALSSDEVHGTTLADASIILKRIIAPSMRIKSSFNIGTEYLGWAEILPVIEASRAESVMLLVGESDIPLTRSGDSWTIQPADLVGKAIATATFGEVSIEKSFEFVEVPVSDSYKEPTNANANMIEVNCGMDIYSRYLKRESITEVQTIQGTVHRLYLGAIPGQFLDSPAEAVIEVSFFGNQTVPLILDTAGLVVADTKVKTKNLVRKWRQEIERVHGLFPTNSVERQALASMKSSKHFAHKCEPSGGFELPPTPHEDDAGIAKKRDVLLASVAARSLRVKGMPSKLWMSMLQERFGIEWKMARLVHRAWLESGLIDELSPVRSPGLFVYARKPKLELFQTEESYIGAVTGLVMPKRLEGMKQLAERSSMTTAMNVGPSSMVPPHLRVRSESKEALFQFAQEAGIEFGYLSTNPFPVETSRESGKPPQGYRPCRAFPTFNADTSASIRAFENSRGPMIWTVENGGVNAWSYSAAHSEFLACHLSGLDNLTRVSSVDFCVKSAFVPLTAARWIVGVGGVPSGPETDDRYLYRFPSPEIADKFIEDYKQNVLEQIHSWQIEKV